MSIRSTIIELSPFAELVREKFSDVPSSPEALAYAIEGHFRAVSDLGPIDGCTNFHTLEETAVSLRIIGMAYVLPSSLLPLEVSFQVVEGGMSYRVLLAQDDKVWNGLTKAKRWNAVYLYATVGQEPQWNWSLPLEGILRP